MTGAGRGVSAKLMSDGYEYLAASRQGIFLIGHEGYRKLADGQFFGITVSGDSIYVFRTVSLDEAASNPNQGAIIQYRYVDGSLSEPQERVSGLDYNGHQIDFYDGSFWLVDSGHQRILEYDRDWTCVGEHRVAPVTDRRGPDDVHVNSFHGAGDRIRVMFHNGHRNRPSEIVEFDRQFRELNRIRLDSTGCHDIVPLEDGTLLYCESIRGQIASADGARYKIDELYTRGLAVGENEIAVGSSLYGARASRALLPGFVTFLDRDYRRIARIHIPAAVTQMCRLDGVDRSLSFPR
jgi:hypothetical protein